MYFEQWEGGTEEGAKGFPFYMVSKCELQAITLIRLFQAFVNKDTKRLAATDGNFFDLKNGVVRYVNI